MTSVLLQDTLTLTFVVTEILTVAHIHVSDDNDRIPFMFLFLFDFFFFGDVLFCVSCVLEPTFLTAPDVYLALSFRKVLILDKT